MDPGLLAQIACEWEATARKAGNVHRFRDFPGLRYTDFLLSAAAIGRVMTHACQRPIGETILEAIQATRRVVQTNTNLGIVLLLAPLAAVRPTEPLELGLHRVLDELSVDDSKRVFAAIRLACPGGLGEVSQQDVRDEPTLPLRAIMALAADRDLIARQYANGFREVLHQGVPWLREFLAAGPGIEQTIILTHLRFLGEHPDSLIARKHGMEKAGKVSARAGSVFDACWRPPRVSGGSITPPAYAGGSPEFADLDSWLVAEGLNPGTSADLVTASLFVALRKGIIPGDAWRVA